MAFYPLNSNLEKSLKTESQSVRKTVASYGATNYPFSFPAFKEVYGVTNLVCGNSKLSVSGITISGNSVTVSTYWYASSTDIPVSVTAIGV